MSKKSNIYYLVHILQNVQKYFIRSLTREFFKSFRTKKRIPPPDPPYSLYQVSNRQIDTLKHYILMLILLKDFFIHQIFFYVRLVRMRRAWPSPTWPPSPCTGWPSWRSTRRASPASPPPGSRWSLTWTGARRTWPTPAGGYIQQYLAISSKNIKQ